MAGIARLGGDIVAHLDLVDVELLVVPELERALALLLVERVLRDLRVFGQLAVRLDCEGEGKANDQSPCYVPRNTTTHDSSPHPACILRSRPPCRPGTRGGR